MDQIKSRQALDSSKVLQLHGDPGIRRVRNSSANRPKLSEKSALQSRSLIAQFCHDGSHSVARPLTSSLNGGNPRSRGCAFQRCFGREFFNSSGKVTKERFERQPLPLNFLAGPHAKSAQHRHRRAPALDCVQQKKG